jgi:putative flippase GtrA
VIGRLVRFGAVGASGAILNLSVFSLLASLAVTPLVASAVSFELALLTNFVLNHHWTFARGGFDISALGRYQLSALGGLLINLVVVHAVGGSILANASGIAAAMIWNAALSFGWTWRTPSLVGQPA